MAGAQKPKKNGFFTRRERPEKVSEETRIALATFETRAFSVFKGMLESKSGKDALTPDERADAEAALRKLIESIEVSKRVQAVEAGVGKESSKAYYDEYFVPLVEPFTVRESAPSARESRNDRREEIEATRMFAEKTHADIDAVFARIGDDIAKAERMLKERPSSKLLAQLETLKLTKQYLEESRDAQKELDDETRFLYEGVFASFTSEKAKEERYQRKGTGGIELMLHAVRHAKAEVRRLQEQEPDPTKRSKLIPKPIEEHELKTIQNRISQGLRLVLGPTSGVLDTGLIVGLYLSNAMARTGQIVSWTDPVYAVAMAAGLATVGVTLENVKRTATTDDIVRSSEYLSDREKKAQGKKKMSWRQIRALLAVGGYSLFQFEAVLVAVAGAQQGGDLNREVAQAADTVGEQINRLELPENFDADSFAANYQNSPSYRNLNATGQFFVNFNNKAQTIIDAEAGGSRVAGAGGTGAVGRGRSWGGKYAILTGLNTTEDEMLASGPVGIAQGMEARRDIQEQFRTRIDDIDLETEESSNRSDRAEGYHDVAEALIARHFDMHATVLPEGVSVEEQLMIFHNDFIDALDEPAFIDPSDPRGERLISLRELYVMYQTGLIDTGAEVALWSDDPFDSVRAKISQSAGITPPSRSTMRPHILRIQDTVPLFEYLQNKLFAERSALLLELVQEQLSEFDVANASSDGGISLEVPRVSIDASPYSEINTEGGASWWSWETHHEAFKNWERAGMSLSVLAIILLINFSPALLTRARIQKTEKTRRDQFSEERKQFEGDGNRQEGAEYLLAEHIAKNLNKLVSSTAIKGIFPSVQFTPDMVQAAMREAAATDEVPVLANSPFSSPDTILGKMFGAMSRYPHDLKHVFIATDLPVPPAVEAFNHLVTLYKDPVALTIRISEQLLPGFSNMMETILQNPDSIKRAMLSHDQFTAAMQNASPEKKQEEAAIRAKILTSIHEAAIGHHAFAKRYAQTKIDHLTNDAFDELYAELAEVSEEQRGKYLDLTKNPINLIEDNIDAFDANNPDMLETMRESGLRQTIASKLEQELIRANALITLADKEIERMEAEETLDTGVFGGDAGRIIKAAQDKRRAKINSLSKIFSESSDPHVRQFSSTTAIKEQVFQDVRKEVLEDWYTSEKQQQRTKNWVGIPVREQLKGMQEAVREEGAYLAQTLMEGKEGAIDAFGKGGPFEGVTVKVLIESRKKQRRNAKGQSQGELSADEGVPQIQVDRHVVTFAFIDREGQEIFKIPVEIRNTLSKVMQKEQIKTKIAQWVANRKKYFSTRVLLDSIDERAHEAQKKNEQEIQSIQQRLNKVGFSVPKPKDGETFDYSQVDLSKKDAHIAVDIYLSELLPRIARRSVLKSILEKRDKHEETVSKVLTPSYTAGKLSDDLKEKTTTRLNIVSRLYAGLAGELKEEGGKDKTLEARVQAGLVENMKRVVSAIEQSRKEIRQANIVVSFSPRSPEFITITHKPNVLARAFRRGEPRVERVSVYSMLEMLGNRPSPSAIASYLKKVQGTDYTFSAK